jgi:hypothetical protein
VRVLCGSDARPAYNTFLTAKRRRALRRDAARLRLGKTEPRYTNLHTAEELAALYERTVQRDEIFEQSVRDFKRIARELDRIREEYPAEIQEAMVALVLEAKRSAEEGGARERGRTAIPERAAPGVARTPAALSHAPAEDSGSPAHRYGAGSICRSTV